ncbi:MAG: serine/threonine-protein kinase [bacterium]|nr:serine/threonine-protein kinase [bacterium]
MEPILWKQIKDAYASAIEMADPAEYLTGLAPNVRSHVERLLRADAEAGDFIAKPFLVEQGSVGLEESSEVAAIDGYNIISPIGTGGMGTVYLADRVGDGFTQRVALKLIKDGMGTDLVLRRFLAERQILAGLDHPNIARMLDGGSTADGLPYFVMEYVDGRPLREFCDDRSLDTRSRVELFAKLCDAVSYAHQKLVVHRDIKPSNIIVDEKGEPKLLDFGIAKLLSPDWQTSDETVTATQFRILTPEYASPEQLRGDPTSTLTDVYSLGIVLYELLTGVRPFQEDGRNPAALADAIRTKEPRKPSVVGIFDTTPADKDAKATKAEAANRTGELETFPATRRSVPDPHALRGDLDNIVLKAIRREPDSRYQSVRDLLEDIERYLHGLPVKATRDTATYRLNKFVKRHRAGVAVTGVSAALLTSALGFSIYQYSQANRERSRAETRFTEVRRFANSILFDHYEQIRNLPGTTEAKAKLVTEAVSYLDAVSKDSDDDPELLRELAKGYRQLAEIQGITAGSGDLGDLAGSKVSLDKSIDIRQKLLAVAPDNVEDLRQLALLLAEYGGVAELSVEERAAYGKRAFEIVLRLRTLNPNKEQAEADYARGLWDRAGANRRLGDNAAAIRDFSEAASIYETFYNNGSGDKRFRRSAALTYKNLGTVHRVAGDPAAALASYEKALAHDLTIAAETPDSVDARLALSFSRRGVGEALNDMARYAEALVSLNEAIKSQEAIRRSDPSNAFAADNLFESYLGAAVAYRGLAKFSDSEDFFRKAFETEAKLKRGKGDDLRLLAVAKTHLEYAQMLIAKNGRSRAARSELEAALATFEEAKGRGALDPAFIADYERTKQLLASA